MRTTIVLGVALLAVSAVAPPAVAYSEVPRSYCLSIQEAGTSQVSQTCSYHDDAPRPAARIRQALAAPEARTSAIVRLCAYQDPHVGRFRVTGIPANADFRVRYTRSDGVDITRAVVAGTYLTRFMVPNDCFRYRITVVRNAAAVAGDVRTFSLTADPEGPGWATLRAATHVKAG